MGIFLDILKDHWQAVVVGIVVSVLSAYCGVMKLERDHYKQKYDTYQAKVEEQEAIQQKKTAQTEANWTNATVSIETAHQNKVNDIRSYYEKREIAFRTASLPPSSNGMPGKPSESGCMSNTTTTPRSIEEVPGNCLSIAEQGSECAQQVIDLQDWYMELVKGQVF